MVANVLICEQYKSDKSQRADPLSLKFEPNGKSDPNVYIYCHQEGHWKKQNVLYKIAHVKSADVAAPLPNPTAGDVAELVALSEMQVKPIDISKIDLG